MEDQHQMHSLMRYMIILPPSKSTESVTTFHPLISPLLAKPLSRVLTAVAVFQ